MEAHSDNSNPASGNPVLRRARSAARLAAVQALYQRAISGTATAHLLHEFHEHRIGKEVDWPGGRDVVGDIDRPFFDDLVGGGLARLPELDAMVGRFLGKGWAIERLDTLLLQILRLGAYELLARPDVPRAAVVSEYVDVADAFYGVRETGFVNALLDRLGKHVRPG